MRYWMNIGHIQFDLFMFGTMEQIVGKLIHCDDTGCTIIKESDGTHHSYAVGVIQHATPAP